VASHKGFVHTFALTSGGCALLGATAVDSCAALARILYFQCSMSHAIAGNGRTCHAASSRRMPSNAICARCGALRRHPWRSLQPATALAVSSCGRHLLVAASTGGAWNAFALDRDGVPAGIAIARKETGTVLHSHAVSLPTPHGLVFSPHAPFAMATDPGSGRMTLLQPSSEEIALLARFESPHGLTPASPVWTSDGKYVIVPNARNVSLSIYEITLVASGSNAGVHLLGTTPTDTPVTALAAHPTQPAVFTSRSQGSGSRLELWKTHGSDLRLAGDTSVPGHVVTLTEHDGAVWVASQHRLIRIPVGRLAQPAPVRDRFADARSSTRSSRRI